jgi:hypothetical protein
MRNELKKAGLSVLVLLAMAFTGCWFDLGEPRQDNEQQSQPEGYALTVKGADNGVSYEINVYDYSETVNEYEMVGTGLGTVSYRTLEASLETPDGADFTADGDFLVVLKDAKDASAPLKYKSAVPFTGGSAALKYYTMKSVKVDTTGPSAPVSSFAFFLVAKIAKDAGKTAQTYSLGSDDEAYNDAVTLTTANSPASVTIDGNGKVITGISNPFTVGSGVTLTLKNITFTRIQFIAAAGGTLVLDDGAVVRGNAAGTGVTVNGGTLEMRDGSSVTENGDSGIWMKGAGGKFTMNGGTISGNHTADEGGGVAMIGTNNEFIMNGGTISGNDAAGYGGGGGVGILGEGAAFTMNGGTISGNDAAYDGGGVEIQGEGAAFTMNGGTISGNKAIYDGGGVGMMGTNNEFIMNGGTISGNDAADEGGGVVIWGSNNKFTITADGTISGNTAYRGGGVSVWAGHEFTMTGGTISGNNASIGGGLYLYSGGTLTGNPQIGGTTAPGAGKGWIHGNTPDDRN